MVKIDHMANIINTNVSRLLRKEIGFLKTRITVRTIGKRKGTGSPLIVPTILPVCGVIWPKYMTMTNIYRYSKMPTSYFLNKLNICHFFVVVDHHQTVHQGTDDAGGYRSMDIE